MTEQDKHLLIRNMCSRLPYKVKMKINSWSHSVTLQQINPINNSSYFKIAEVGYDFRTWEEDIKLYLRSMSSMTDEEKTNICSKANIDYIDSDIVDFGEFLSEGSPVKITDIVTIINWLNAYHFDYDGLIDKGLAIEAPEGLYNN